MSSGTPLIGSSKPIRLGTSAADGHSGVGAIPPIALTLPGWRAAVSLRTDRSRHVPA